MSAELVKAYTEYRVKRARIKARQRAELDQELIPEAIAIGAAFIREQEAGKSVVDIAASIGLKNRTFLYQMKRVAQTLGKGEKTPEIAPEPLTEASPEPEYELDSFANGYIVRIDGHSYAVITDDKGKVIKTPDEWATHSKERRTLYKEIVKVINSGNIDVS